MSLLQEHVSLQAFNTFGVAAQARYYAHIADVQALEELPASPVWKEFPRLVLGGGSNILFVKDFAGLVVHIGIKGIEKVVEDSTHVWIRAGAGVDWHALVTYCVARDYGGIENLSLIPGTTGAAPVQNIGAYGVELSDVFESLEAFNLDTGKICTFSKQACSFGYRDSVFKNSLKGQYIITHVTLKLQKHPTFHISYGAIKTTLEAMGVRVLSIHAISQAVIRIRQSKLPDPATLGNAGSFFKNPVIHTSQFEALKSKHPQIPHYVQPNDQVKVPAGWLIEQCGWKGQRRGRVGVHAQHALILVNHGGGTGITIYQLAQAIQQSVHHKFGIALTPEVNLIG